ncbi:MAG: secretin N-terminal domain-containing protein, partial [bacterium]
YKIFLFMLCFLLITGETRQAHPSLGKEKKVSLQFRNVNIHDVFKTLAMAGGINIVASKAVQGTVTIFVDSLNVMDALGLVVEMQGLAYYREHGIIRVVQEEEYKKRFGKAFKDRMRTRVIKLHYASTEQVVKSIFQLKSKGGNVIADQRSNSLILVDLPAVLRDMEAVIKQVDVPLMTHTFSLTHVAVQNVEEIVRSMVSSGGRVKIDPGTNQLIVIDDPERIERIKKFIEKTDVPSAAVMEIFSLQYADAEAVVNRLQSELTPGIGSAVADKTTNKVFVQDLPDNLPYLRQLIETLDQRTQQVLIEAKIIQITLKDEFKMGVDWQALTNRFGGVIDFSSSFRILGDKDNGGRVRGTGITAGSSSLTGLIEALQTVGKTDLLSNPRITCIDGQEAYILVGSTVPYKTIDTREDQGGTLRTFERVITVEVGVKLKVTPIINDDGFITMKIRPEVSEVTSFNDNIPIIEKSESETTVIVKDGVTIIIGGLIKDQEIKDEKRVPLLGSIPLLGLPFRSKKTTKTKSELVILLRPQILTGDVNMDREEG